MSQRLERVNRLLKEEISMIIQQDIDNPRIGFITITRVVASAGLRLAKVYVSIMSEDKEKEDILRTIKELVPYIKKLLATRVELRYLPDLKFFEDKTINESMRIEELLRQVKEKEEGKKHED